MASEIVVWFVSGAKIPFNASADDIAISVAPHQEPSAAKRSIGELAHVSRFVPAGCVVSGHTQPGRPPPIDDLISKGFTPSGVWLDAFGMPAGCLASNIARWIQATQNHLAGMLAVAIRGGPARTTPREGVVWRIDAARPLSRDEREAKSFIWYPALSRDATFLAKCADALNPVDIFPVVAFPDQQSVRSDESLVQHHELLQSYRVRTERMIYIPADKPNVAFSVLSRSLAALPRSSSAPREGIITPGLPSFLYVAELLSAVMSSGALMVDLEESPFEGSEITGLVVLVRRP